MWVAYNVSFYCKSFVTSSFILLLYWCDRVSLKLNQRLTSNIKSFYRHKCFLNVYSYWDYEIIKNPTICNIIRWLTGSLNTWLIDQASDVPSIIFFLLISCKILCKNHFYVFLYFSYKFTKIRIKSFECHKSIRNHEKT